MGSLLLFYVFSAGVAQMRLTDLCLSWFTHMVDKLLMAVSYIAQLGLLAGGFDSFSHEPVSVAAWNSS